LGLFSMEELDGEAERFRDWTEAATSSFLRISTFRYSISFLTLSAGRYLVG
jgi:hypothetical protein